MDNKTEQRERRNRKARERQAKRRERRETIASIGNDGLSKLANLKPDGIPEPLQRGFTTTWTIIQDSVWHIRNRKTSFWKIAAGIVAAVVLIFFAALFFSPNIGPNITTMGIKVGGMSVEAATEKLQSAMEEDIRVRLRLDGQQMLSVNPAEIGITLDAEATALAAKEAGLSGFPFGHEVEPVFEISYSTAQNYFLGIVNDVYIPAYEAGYEWRDGDVVSVAGRASRELDVVLTVQRIVDNPLSVIERQQLELLTTSLEPTVMDSTPYLEDARAFINSELTIIGYDPFTNEEQQWQTDRDAVAAARVRRLVHKA